MPDIAFAPNFRRGKHLPRPSFRPHFNFTGPKDQLFVLRLPGIRGQGYFQHSISTVYFRARSAISDASNEMEEVTVS